MTERDTSVVDAHSPQLFGVNPAAVVEAIQSRHARRAAGDSGSDGRKIAIVVEGGGMRGVLSGGGMVALAKLGYTDLFDCIYATSAGVMNASYFLSHQPELGISVYYESLAGRQFWNPYRFWKILDVDYVFDRVVTMDKPLDVARVMASPTRFFVSMMDRLGRASFVDVQSSGYPLLKLLKAAVAAPVFYNRSIALGDARYADCGLIHPIPIRPAIEAGCTDILVLLTRSRSYECESFSIWQKIIFELLCARGTPALTKVFAEQQLRTNELRQIAFGQSAAGSSVNIATLCAAEPETVKLATLDPTVLLNAAIKYGRETLQVFGRADIARSWGLASSSSR